MSYAYRPRDPRAKLREVAVKWVSAMRVSGRGPNRGVVFGDGGGAAGSPHAHGYLVDDRRPQAAGARYLVLEDGDVLRAPEEQWLGGPDDELVTVFSKSLADARLGGSGWLADGAGGVEQVPDRREESGGHEGPERRARS